MTPHVLEANPRRPPLTPERVAYHEAGHATWAILNDWPIRLVTIIPDPERGALGCVFLDTAPAAKDFDEDQDLAVRCRAINRIRSSCNPARALRLAWDGATFALAGIAAEAHRSGIQRMYWTEETDEALTVLGAAYPEDEVPLLLFDGHKAVWDTFNGHAVWAGLREIADALLEYRELGGKTVKRLFELAYAAAYERPRAASSSKRAGCRLSLTAACAPPGSSQNAHGVISPGLHKPVFMEVN